MRTYRERMKAEYRHLLLTKILPNPSGHLTSLPLRSPLKYITDFYENLPYLILLQVFRAIHRMHRLTMARLTLVVKATAESPHLHLLLAAAEADAIAHHHLLLVAAVVAVDITILQRQKLR